MDQAKEFNLLQTRDFGDLLQDSIRFVLRNARIYLLSLVVFVGSIYLMIAILSAWLLGGMLDLASYFQSGMMDPEALFENMMTDFGSTHFISSAFTIGLLAIAASVTLRGVVYGIMRAYHESPDGIVELPEVQRYVRDMFMPYLGLTFLTGLIIFGGALVFVLLFAVAGAMDSGVLAFILGLALVIGLIYVSVVFLLTFPARMQENISSPASISRAFQLIKGHWWQTFGVIFIIGLISVIIQLIVESFGGMFAGLTGGGFMGTMTIIGGAVISMLIGGFFSAVSLTAAGFQYFNLQEEEQHEDSLIDEIGAEMGDRGLGDESDSDGDSVEDGDEGGIG